MPVDHSETKTIKNKAVFTVSLDLIPTNKTLGFPLLINSSARKGVERFIRIWTPDKAIQKEDLLEIQKKYGHIYVEEKDRSRFFSALGGNPSMTASEKMNFLKQAATQYMEKLFTGTPEALKVGSLNETIYVCRGAIEGMLHSLNDKDLFGLSDLITELDFHDHYTLDHSINTGLYNMMLYRELKQNSKQSELILPGLCGMFHDIGKIKLPNSIINATEGLSENDYELIRKHPEWGKQLINRPDIAVQTNDLNILSQVIYQHHENYNGTGYPNQLKGEEINLFARMTSISDFFDAITTKRSYHSPLSPLDALGVIENAAGKKIDPKIFTVLKKKIVGPQKLDSELHLHEDFDPCRPYKKIPLEVTDEIPKSSSLEMENEESMIDYSKWRAS